MFMFLVQDKSCAMWAMAVLFFYLYLECIKFKYLGFYKVLRDWNKFVLCTNKILGIIMYKKKYLDNWMF